MSTLSPVTGYLVLARISDVHPGKDPRLSGHKKSAPSKFLFHYYLPYGKLHHMLANLILRDKFIYADTAIREMVIWRLPEADKERPHGLKYSLFYGYPGKSLLRYDNERGKGDHRHIGDLEENYRFNSVEQLIQDFRTDIDKLRGSSNE